MVHSEVCPECDGTGRAIGQLIISEGSPSALKVDREMECWECGGRGTVIPEAAQDEDADEEPVREWPAWQQRLREAQQRSHHKATLRARAFVRNFRIEQKLREKRLRWALAQMGIETSAPMDGLWLPLDMPPGEPRVRVYIEVQPFQPEKPRFIAGSFNSPELQSILRWRLRLDDAGQPVADDLEQTMTDIAEWLDNICFRYPAVRPTP